MTETDLLFFDVRPILQELPNSIEFLRVYAKKLEESYVQMWQVREVMRESAVVRWRWFQNTYPDLQNVMQLKDVASFLGMTPVTLSRIRAKQSKAEKKRRMAELERQISGNCRGYLTDRENDGIV